MTSGPSKRHSSAILWREGRVRLPLSYLSVQAAAGPLTVPDCPLGRPHTEDVHDEPWVVSIKCLGEVGWVWEEVTHYKVDSVPIRWSDVCLVGVEIFIYIASCSPWPVCGVMSIRSLCFDAIRVHGVFISPQSKHVVAKNKGESYVPPFSFLVRYSG